MSKNWILLGFFLVMFLFPTVIAGTKDLPGGYILEYELLSNTKYCLVDCSLKFRLKLNKDYTISSLSKFKSKFIKAKNALNLRDWGFKIRMNETYYVYIPKTVCNPIYIETLPNGTDIYDSNCETQWVQEERWRYVWNTFNPLGKTIKANKWYYIELWGRKHLKLGENNIDAIPSIMDFDLPFAWWNSTYLYRYPILSNSTIVMPISVNDTDLVNNITYWTLNASVGETVYVYCENSGCASGLIAIANDTDEKDWEREDTVTGNNVTTLWTDAKAVYHLHNTTGIDSTGVNNAHNTIGSPTTVVGVFGNAISYANTDTCTNLTKTYPTNATNFTIELWFKTSTTLQNLATLWGSFADGTIAFRYRTSEGTIVFDIYDGNPPPTWYTIPMTGTYNDGNWHYLVGVVNTSATAINMSLYEDGVLVGINSSLVATDWTTNWETHDIGGRSTNALQNYTGYIDNVILWDYPVSEDYIRNQWYAYQNNLTALGSEDAGAEEVNITLYFNGTDGDMSINFTDVVNITAVINITGLNLELYMNNTLINNDTTRVENITDINWFNGGTVYEIKANWLGNTSYSSSSRTYYITVNKSTNDSALSLTSSPGWTVTEGTSVTITCSATPPIILYKDNVNTSSPYSAVLPFGTYNFTCVVNETMQNYTYSPSSMTHFLTVTTGGFGCTSNRTFAFTKTISLSGSVVLNFTDLVSNDLVKNDLTDVYVNQSLNLTVEKNTSSEGYYIFVNSTNVSSFTVQFGNYIANESYSSNSTPLTYENDSMGVYTQLNSYYVLTLLDEITGNQQLPPNSNRTMNLICSNGTSSFNLTDSKFLVATFQTLEEIKTTISYSVTEIYYRNLLVTSNIEYKNVYLADAEKNQVVQLLIELQDNTGDFSSSILRVKKTLEGTVETMTEGRFDAENKILIYLINGEKYSLYVDNGVEVRSIGFLYVDTVDLTKTLTISEILALNETWGNVSYRLYRSGDDIIFSYVDSTFQTYNVSFWVYNYSDDTQLYLASTTNRSIANFIYTVTDTNGTYLAKVSIMHTFYGNQTFEFAQVFGALAGLIAIPASIPVLFPAMLVTGMSVIFVMSIPMLFGGIEAGTAGIVTVLIAALLAWWGWINISMLIIIIALALAVLNKLRERRSEI